MIKKFEYLYELKPQEELEINDIGNCCIHVLNAIGYEWYLIIETEMGKCSMKTFGPFHVDIPNYFDNGFNFNFMKREYKESIICNKIDDFINDGKKAIIQAILCDKEEAYEKLRNLNFKEMR